MTEKQVYCPMAIIEKFDSKKGDFTIFKERLNQSFVAYGITTMERKRAILLNSLNEECYVIVRSLCVPNLPETKTFDQLITLLTDYFSPLASLFGERKKFYHAKKGEGESVAEWSARVKQLAANCKFGEELTVVLRNIFTIGMDTPKIKDRLFEEDPTSESTTLTKMVRIAKNKESALMEQDQHARELPGGSADVKSEVEVHFSEQRRAPGLGWRPSHRGQAQSTERVNNMERIGRSYAARNRSIVETMILVNP
ncbi:hypothetical protein NQ318_022584 [Aromia moschata]|uniref:Gag protein n=1 Tax=Aromia moschata TaxID=1265417 RepID=A0AAV8XYZ1_9CUCU|nr:hypothetical protein NQ318_022584 [Aromia moschata]